MKADMSRISYPTYTISFHQGQTTLAVIDNHGETVVQKVLPNNEEVIKRTLAEYPTTTAVGLEATRNWYWQYDLLKEAGYKVKVANPHMLRANLLKKKKTDMLDALQLAQLLRVNLFPSVTPAVAGRRALGELLRMWQMLLKHRGQLKNRIHAQLGKHNLTCPHTDLFGKEGMVWIESRLNEIPPYSKRIITGCLALLTAVAGEMAQVEADIQHAVHDDPIYVHLIKTIPGVGSLTVAWLVAAIGDMSRFPSAKRLCAYFGMVPSTYQSADNTRHGHITRMGNGTIRAVMVQAAHRAVRFNKTSAAIFYRIAKKRGKKIAYVAVARKLMTMICYEYRTVQERTQASL